MHRTLNDIGAPSTKGECAHKEGQNQKHAIDVIEAEMDSEPGIKADCQHRRYRQSDRGERRAQAHIDRPLQLIV